MLRTATVGLTGVAVTAAVAVVAAPGVSVPGHAAMDSTTGGAGTGTTGAAARTPLDAWTLRLGRAADLPSGPGGASQTRRLHTTAYEMVAVTWRGAPSADVAVRTRPQGSASWSGWRVLEPVGGHGLDTGTTESRRRSARVATELVWAGASDGVQVRVDAPERGPGVRAARVVLVDPGTLPSDRPAVGRPAANPTRAPEPVVRSRSAWGANESWRSSRPVYNNTIKQAHIHHTAGSNAYSRSDVPAIIRGDYWYHTQVLGWSDLGYNFVVDRFGRIWEGRAGGVDRPVRGAHTLGFNHASFGVAAIGDYDNARPSAAMVRALVRLTAWKLDKYGRQPAGHTTVTSSGSDYYPGGTRVRLPVIDGHRDTNQTACPGDRLYARLPDIRRRAQHRADAVFVPGTQRSAG